MGEHEMVPLRNGQLQCAGCGMILNYGPESTMHKCARGHAVEAEAQSFIAMHDIPKFEDAVNRNSRAVLLDEAGALIDGQRAKDYGDAAENFQRIANGWAEILGKPVTVAQVALCMDWLKTCRLITSPGHRDSWVDKLGYAALGGEVAL